MKKHVFNLVFLTWVLIVVVVGVYRSASLSSQLDGNGPLALASTTQGDTWLASRDTLYRLDVNERLQLRVPASALGLRKLNALAIGQNDTLWIYDSQQRQPFRCQTQPLRCSPFGPTTLRLDKNVQMAESSNGELLLSDNTHHRIVRLSQDGKLLDDGHNDKRHYPNQISVHDDRLYLADSDHHEILVLPMDAAGAGSTALRNESRPYRFVRRGNEWWVIEAGIKLEHGIVRHYRNGHADTLALDISDPTSIADNGQRLLISSLSDWRLLSLDPVTGTSRAIYDAALNREFAGQQHIMADARKERSHIPLFMIALMLPAIGMAGIVQRRRGKMTPDGRQASVITRQDMPGQPCTIVPDLSALERFQAQSRQRLLRAMLYVLALSVVVLLATGLILWMSPGQSMDMLWFMGAGIIALMLVTGYAAHAAQKKQRLQYEQSLVLGERKAIWSCNGKPRAAVPYSDIWLSPGMLLLGRHRLPLFLAMHGQRIPLWPNSDIQREIGMRIPPEQHADTDFQLMTVLLRKRRPLDAASLLLAKAGPAIAIILVVLLKLWSKMDWIVSYWFHH